MTAMAFSPDGYIGSTGIIDEGFPSYYGPVKFNNTVFTFIDKESPSKYLVISGGLTIGDASNPPSYYKTTGTLSVVDSSTNFTFGNNRTYCIYIRINI